MTTIQNLFPSTNITKIKFQPFESTQKLPSILQLVITIAAAYFSFEHLPYPTNIWVTSFIILTQISYFTFRNFSKITKRIRLNQIDPIWPIDPQIIQHTNNSTINMHTTHATSRQRPAKKNPSKKEPPSKLATLHSTHLTSGTRPKKK